MHLSHQILLYYKYTKIADPESYCSQHHALCNRLHLKGRILIAHEGINGTVSGLYADTEKYKKTLQEDPLTKGIEFKVDPAQNHVFPKLSLKIRSEIVTLGLGKKDIDPNKITGKYLSPKEFHETMQHEDTVILDGRNQYESALGKIRGALCPPVDNFRDFPKWIRENKEHLQNKKILTYCTGGIRCEKLSGFLLREGFQDVAQLHGGIIEYGKDKTARGEFFEGKCYVFDERISVDINQTEKKSIISSCAHCNQSSSRYINCGYPPCNKQFFCCESCEESNGPLCSERCMERIPTTY